MAIDRTAAHGNRHRAGGSDWLPVSAAGRLLGRGSTGPGAMQELTLGPGLVVEGTELSATGGGGGGAPDPHHATHETGGADAIVNLDAGILTSGTLPDARFPATLPAVSGANLTNLNASNLASGTIASARLPPYYDYLEGTPANPAADTLRMYAVDYNGFTILEERDSAGRTIRTSRDTVAVGKVDEAAGIVRGQCVYVSGATGANRLLKKALATGRATTPAFGLAMESGAQNTFIRILTSGLLTGLDTSAIAEGARVFLSETTAGDLTVTAPLAPNLVQRVGWVLRQHATQGEIGVLPATALSEASWAATHADMHAAGGRDPLIASTLAAAGATTQVQFNDGGVFGGDSGLTFNKTTDALTIGGLLTVNGFGTHTFSAGGTGTNLLTVRNTSAGTSNYAALRVGNDASASLTELASFSSTYAASGHIFANGTRLYVEGVGGLSIVASHGSAMIRFYTANTEWARLDNNGQFLVGRTTALSGSGVVQIQSNPFSNWTMNLRHTGNLNGGIFIGFLNASDAVQGSITSGGAGTTVAYNTSSDERLKLDAGRATDLSALRAVVVHDFTWRADGRAARGVFAQETYPVFPRAITVGGDERTPDGALARPWMTDYSTFVPDLLVGWQQHDTLLSAVLARLAALEGRN